MAHAVDITDTFARKVKALQQHTSQTAHLGDGLETMLRALGRRQRRHGGSRPRGAWPRRSPSAGCAEPGGEGRGVNVDALLVAVPPMVVYLVVGLVVGVESMGIPLPGEVVLVSAALLSSRQELDVSPAGVAAAAAVGAVLGDSVGFAVGRRFGDRLFTVLGRRFPRHVSAAHVSWAEHVFTRYGVLAVFFGRFIALLRIFAGPLAGALRMPYRRFLVANVLGALVWAGGTTAASTRSAPSPNSGCSAPPGWAWPWRWSSACWSRA